MSITVSTLLVLSDAPVTVGTDSTAMATLVVVRNTHACAIRFAQFDHNLAINGAAYGQGYSKG